MKAGSLTKVVSMVQEAGTPDVPQVARLSLGNGWTARVLLRPSNAPPVPGLQDAVLTQAAWRDWLKQPHSLFPPTDHRDILKQSSTTLVCRLRMPTARGRTLDVICKRRVSRHRHKRLLAMVRLSRPQRTWHRAMALLEAGIPTARPLAVLERRRFGLLFESVLITEYLRNAVDLELLLTVRMRELDPQRVFTLKRELAEGIAAFIHRVQNAGFVHRDFKALNVIVQWNPEIGDQPRISVVDLDGIRRSSAAPSRGHLRMLMRLNVSVDPFRRVSLTDRLRVLQQYLARAGHPRSEWKSLWHRLAAMSDRKRASRARQQERAFRKYGRY
jgi:hypothetical protein